MLVNYKTCLQLNSVYIRIQKYIKSSCDSTVVAASCMHILSWSHLFLKLNWAQCFLLSPGSVFGHCLCFHVLTAHFIHLWSSMVVCVTESRRHWWWSWGIWDKQGSHHLHFLAWERYEIWNLQDEFFEINDEPFSYFRSHFQKKHIFWNRKLFTFLVGRGHGHTAQNWNQLPWRYHS